MKRLLTILLSFLFISFQSVKADNIGVGITGAMHSIDISGTETTRNSGQKNNGSHTEIHCDTKFWFDDEQLV